MSESVHWIGDAPTSLHGNGAASFAHTTRDRSSVTCTLCLSILERDEAAEIPSGFWAQIDHQLERIATEGASFDDVREVLLDERYDAIVIENSRNGARDFGTDGAFFAGSGGDASLRDALKRAGWRIVQYEAAYYYVVRSTAGDHLTYCEGDVLRGNQLLSD